MMELFKKYAFKKSNKITLVFLPGFNGGLSTPIIKFTINNFIHRKNIDVLGMELFYKDDHMDIFDKSQNSIIDAIKYLQKEYPHKQVYIVAKSLGGSISLFNLEKMAIKGLVILGFPVVLGWPQRVSLLSSNNPITLEYKSEWIDSLLSILIKTTVVTGFKDDLVDNDFLSKIAMENPNFRIVSIPNANHNLQDMSTGEVFTQQCVKVINDMIT